jgi:serine/threonine protein kinase
MELPRLTVLKEQFAIRSVLGELGPFEVTYLAWDLQREVQVIIREFLPVPFAKRDSLGIHLQARSEREQTFFEYGVQRYLQEAALIARIDHPNVVKERAYFKENGTVYRISEYHPGASLAEVLDQQGDRVSPRTAVAIMMPLMDGIRAGHKHGLIHGSISPRKIYLSKTGRPMVLSHKTTLLLLAQRAQLLEAFQQPGFAPPEQYTPRGKHGPWSDVYGCAATLYAILTGDPLPDIPSRLQGDTVPSLLKQAPEVPEFLRPVLLRALDMKMANRPQTIQAFQGELAEAFELPPPPPLDDPPLDAPDSSRDTSHEPIDAPAPSFERPKAMVDPPGVEGGNGFQASASPYLSNPSEPEPVRVKPQTVARTNERPVYRLEDLDFVDEEAFGDGSYGLEPSPETKRPEASAPEASASETTQPVKAYPFTPVQYDTPSPVRRQEKKVQKNTVWNNAYQYESAPLEKPRRGRRMALIGIMTGCFLVLSYLAFLRWQSLEVETYQFDFQSFVILLFVADSLISLAKDVSSISYEVKS